MSSETAGVCTVAEAVIRALRHEGIDTVFGYPGGAILPIYDALLSSPIRHVLTRHEQGAVHAAEGYAKTTGKVGVVMATSGPGATNLVTGLLDALLDSIPLVAITGQVPRNLLGRDAFQEADILGITLPATKQNYLVRNPEDCLRILSEAFHVARSGRPGPVLIDIPKDVAYARIRYEYPVAIEAHLQQPGPLLDCEALETAADLLAAAARPLIVCGGGVVSSRGASTRLGAIADHLQSPVVCTLQGLGGFSGYHPLYIGMLGMHGLYAANKAVQNADVIVGVGVRFDDRVTGKLSQFAPDAKIIHIDIDRAELGKNVPTYVGLQGDAAFVLEELYETLRVRECDTRITRKWLEQVRSWHRQYPVWGERRREFRVPVIDPEVLAQVAASAQNPGNVIPLPEVPAHLRVEDVLRAVQVVFGPESIVVTDVGQHQMWAAHFCLRTEPRTFISSAGLGTMGFGLPAGIGVALARPGKQVVVITGDGGFQMNPQELSTIVAEQIPVKIMVINNGYLGMVRQWQQLFYDNRYSAVDLRPGMPDFVRLAEAYGIRGMRVDHPALLPWAVQQARSHSGPMLIEFRVEQEENVWPMVSPGAANDEMLIDGKAVNDE